MEKSSDSTEKTTEKIIINEAIFSVETSENFGTNKKPSVEILNPFRKGFDPCLGFDLLFMNYALNERDDIF